MEKNMKKMILGRKKRASWIVGPSYPGRKVEAQNRVSLQAWLTASVEAQGSGTCDQWTHHDKRIRMIKEVTEKGRPWNGRGVIMERPQKNVERPNFGVERPKWGEEWGPFKKHVFFYVWNICKFCKILTCCKIFFTPLARHGVLGELSYICQDICFKSGLLNLGLYFRIGPLYSGLLL